MSNPSDQPAPAKSSQWTRIAYGFGAVCLGIAAFVRFAGVFATSGTADANNLKNQAIVSIEESDKHAEIGLPCVESVFAPATIAGIPGTRDAIRADAEKGIAEFKAAADKLRKASELFDEASKKQIDSHYAEYLTVMSKQLGVLADVKDNLVQQFQMMLDAANDDGEKLAAALEEMDGKVAVLTTQAAGHREAADKIVADHPAVFTK